MKKLFGLAGLVVLFASTNVMAQGNQSRVNSSVVPNEPETAGVIAPSSNLTVSKAARDFSRSYKNAANAEWFQTYRGWSVVYFTEGGNKMKSVYNKKGKWEYTLRFFTVKEVPADVRDLVKTFYENYTINQAVEVERFDKKVTLVYVENEKQLKTLRIFDGEIEVAQAYRKSK